MIKVLLFFLYFAIGFAIVSCLVAFLDEISEFLFMFTVVLWPLLIVIGIAALNTWPFTMVGGKIGKFLRRKFDEK